MPPKTIKWTAKKVIAKPRQTSVKVQPKVQPKATKTVKKQTDDMKIGTNLFSNLNSNIDVKLKTVDKPKVEKSIKDEKLVAVTTEIETMDNNTVTDAKIDIDPSRFKDLKIGTKWVDEDTEMLKKLYLIDKLNFSEIVAKMRRGKNVIITKLAELGIEKDVEKIRGDVDAFDKSDYAKLLNDYYNYKKIEKKEKMKEDSKIVKRVREEDKHIKIITELNDKIKNMDEKIDKLSMSMEILTKQNIELALNLNIMINNLKNHSVDTFPNEKKEDDTIIQEKKEIKHKNGKTYIVYGNDVFLKSGGKIGIHVGEYKNDQIVFTKN